MTFVLCFIGYMPVTFDIQMIVDVEHEQGVLESYDKSHHSLDIFHGKGWVFSEGNQYHIPLECSSYGYDLDTLFFSIKGGINKITFYSFVASIWGAKTVESTGLELGQHTYTCGGLIPSLEGEVFSLTMEDPDAETLFMITGYQFIPIWFWIVYFLIVSIINLIVTLIFVRIFSNFKYWKGSLLSITISVTALLLGMFINEAISYITYDYFFLNWIIIFIICNIINCMSVHYIGTIVGSGLVLLWYCANYFVILFRGKPITPSDLYAIKTAGEVANGYSIMPTWKMVVSFLIWLALCIALIIISRKEHKRVSIPKRVIGIGISVIAFILCLHNPIYSSLNTFVWDAKLLDDFYTEGMVLSFTRSYFSSFVRKPEGYSKEAVAEYLEQYQDSEQNMITEESGVKPTRVIMIMNEAFSDLRDSGMTDAVDVMPYIDSLKDDTAEGTVYASVYGGGTCNTEFEALTGNSMAFLPANSYPYSQYVKDDLFSLADYFTENGYQTAAFHPGTNGSWNRNLVYPRLGFRQFYSRDEYEGIEYLHKLPSDLSNYQFIEKTGEETGIPSFSFNVTYQNHSGYDTWEDVPKNESALQIPTNDAQIYLSLVAESDKAVEQLIDYYKDSEEPTMIVFFGDHQPGLSTENNYYIYNNDISSLNKYKTKMFIWSNYETEEEEGLAVSANYLPLLVLEKGGFVLPPYLKMLKDVYEEYPVITSQGVLDKEGNYYSDVEELETDPLIKMYRYIQYANMFDDIDPAWFEINVLSENEK